jgi:tripartite-type tricarboxylate transporter receptor subunit TctC
MRLRIGMPASSMIFVCLYVMLTQFLLLPGSAKADDFYKGKTVSIVVGATPGGAFDLISRSMSRFMGKHLPGRPNVVVQNMPGAGSLTSLTFIESVAPADGTVMGTFLPGIITQSVVAPENVRVNFSNVSWVGVVSADYSRVCYGFGPNGVKSWNDLILRQKDNPFIMGTTGTGASNYINGSSLREVFGANVRIIMGFPGSSELRLAIERGELEGDCGGMASIPSNWIQNSRAHVFVRFSERLMPGIPSSAVYVGDLAKTADERDLLELLYAADKLGRPYVAPARISLDRLALLRAGFNETMRDPGFVGEMEKLQETIYPLTGQEAEAIIAGMRKARPEIVKKARRIYE